MSAPVQDGLIDIERIVRTRFPDRKVPAWVLRRLARFIHQDLINEYLSKGLEGTEFCEDVIRGFDVKVEVEGLDDIPADGTRYTFASNHPLGGMDGLILFGLLGRRFGRLVSPANDFLMHIGPLSPFFVPVNKVGVQVRELPRMINEAFASDSHVLIFPAGKVSRKGDDGVIRDDEWKKAVIEKSVAYGRSVVPVHFIGTNSGRFYRVARFCKRFGIKFNAAMVLLPDEMYRSQHKSFRIVFGKPVPASHFDKSRTSSQWAAWLRDEAYKL